MGEEWRVTIRDDNGPEQELCQCPTEDAGGMVFDMIRSMVTRPGNKREGDAVTVTLYHPSGVVADRYERQAWDVGELAGLVLSFDDVSRFRASLSKVRLLVCGNWVGYDFEMVNRLIGRFDHHIEVHTPQSVQVRIGDVWERPDGTQFLVWDTRTLDAVQQDIAGYEEDGAGPWRLVGRVSPVD